MNTQWQYKYFLEYNDLVAQFPSPEKIISDYINHKFRTELPWFSWADPDRLYFIRFSQNRSNNKSYTGWDHLGKYKTESLTLTQAAIVNIGSHFEDFDEANAIAGIYKINNAYIFDETNEAKMLPSEYLYFLSDCDFFGLYNKALSDYWAKNYTKFSLLLKNYYISSALHLFKKKIITEGDYNFAIDVLTRSNNISLFYFDIYRYYSSDMFIAENDKRIMLFSPGSSLPLLFADNITDLREKIRNLIITKENRNTLLQHFSLYDRQDGTTFYGVDSVLEHITRGDFADTYFMYSRKPLDDIDIFESITFSIQERSFSDGDSIIKSNSEAQRDYALSVIQTIVSLMPLFDIFIPELSVPLGLGLVASGTGISFDQLINGDTYEERRAAIPGIATNAVLLGLSFIIPYLIGKAGENKILLNQITEDTNNIINIDDFLEEYNINKTDVPDNGMLTVELKDTNITINLIRLNDENGRIAAVRGNTLSGIYYEVNTSTGYEILSRRIFRTEYNDTVFWTRGGGLKGGQPFNFDNIDIPVFFIDKPYSELASSEALSFINDDSPLLFPEIDARLPKPTSEMDIKYYFSHYSDFKERTVTLMRGTTEEEAWKIAAYKTAGGSNKELEEIFIGGGPQANLSFTEYTSSLNSADTASRRHFLVVIKVQVRYISNEGVLYATHWAIPDEAPVEVLAVVDRRFIFPEPASAPELSFIQKISRRFFREDIAETSRVNFRRLNTGNINVLKGRGAFSSRRQRSIYLHFNAANSDTLRPGEVYLKKSRFDDGGYDRYFYNDSAGLNGVPTLNTYTGEFVTDSSSIGATYWRKYNMTSDTSIIYVSNSARGANGIRISIQDIQQNKPVIITSGELSGCTTIFTRKGNHLYGVHTGTSESLSGFTSTTGVIKAIEVLSTLAELDIPVMTETINNNFLVDFLAEHFDNSLISYSSSHLKPESIISINRENVFTFPYYTDDIIPPAFGTSVAILVRQDENITVRVLSESYSVKPGSTGASVFNVLSKDL